MPVARLNAVRTTAQVKSPGAETLWLWWHRKSTFLTCEG